MADDLSAALQALYEGRRDDAERLAHEPDLLEAAALGRLDVLRTHLDGDPDALSARTPDGFTALHLAAFTKDVTEDICGIQR